MSQILIQEKTGTLFKDLTAEYSESAVTEMYIHLTPILLSAYYETTIVLATGNTLATKAVSPCP